MRGNDTSDTVRRSPVQTVRAPSLTGRCIHTVDDKTHTTFLLGLEPPEKTCDVKTKPNVQRQVEDLDDGAVALGGREVVVRGEDMLRS